MSISPHFERCALRSRAAWVAVRGLLLAMLVWAGVGAANAQPVSLGNGVMLTDIERAYVTAHSPVTFCVDPDWWPFEVID